MKNDETLEDRFTNWADDVDDFAQDFKTETTQWRNEYLNKTEYSKREIDEEAHKAARKVRDRANEYMDKVDEKLDVLKERARIIKKQIKEEAKREREWIEKHADHFADGMDVTSDKLTDTDFANEPKEVVECVQLDEDTLFCAVAEEDTVNPIDRLDIDVENAKDTLQKDVEDFEKNMQEKIDDMNYKTYTPEA